MKNVLSLEDFLITEMNKKELYSNGDMARLDRSKRIKVVYDRIKVVNNFVIVQFESIDTSKNGSGKSWTQKIKLMDYDINSDDIKDYRKAIRGNIEVHCNCPDFLYHGYKYIGTQKEYSIEKENRKPVIRNPNEDGTVCKHLLAVLNKLPNFVKQSYKELKDERK